MMIRQQSTINSTFIRDGWIRSMVRVSLSLLPNNAFRFRYLDENSIMFLQIGGHSEISPLGI